MMYINKLYLYKLLKDGASMYNYKMLNYKDIDFNFAEKVGKVISSFVVVLFLAGVLFDLICK